MSILPWENWIYHVDYKKEELTKIHKELLEMKKEILRLQNSAYDISRLSRRLYIASRSLSAYEHAWKADHEEYKELKYKILHQDLSLKQNMAYLAGQDLAALSGSYFAFSFIMQLGKVGFNAVTSITRAVPETAIEAAEVDLPAEGGAELTAEAIGEDVAEGAVEVAAEGATLGAFASTGVGILLAVGIDFVMGVLEGAKESKELDEMLEKLKKARNTVRSVLDEALKKNAGYVKSICGELKFIVDTLPEIEFLHGSKKCLDTATGVLEDLSQLDAKEEVNFVAIKNAINNVLTDIWVIQVSGKPFIHMRNRFTDSASYGSNEADIRGFIDAYNDMSDHSESVDRDLALRMLVPRA